MIIEKKNIIIKCHKDIMVKSGLVIFLELFGKEFYTIALIILLIKNHILIE